MNILSLLYISSVVLSKVYELQENKEVTLNSKEDLQLKLKSNPSTGYYWKITLADNTQLESNSAEGEFMNQDSAAVGAASHQVFTLKCKPGCSPNTETAVFTYSRPWEKSAIRTIKLKIQIDQSPSPDL